MFRTEGKLEAPLPGAPIAGDAETSVFSRTGRIVARADHPRIQGRSKKPKGRVIAHAWWMPLTIIFLLGNSNVNALDPQKAITQFTHRKWGAAEGIIQVSSICQTSDGYIWVAS